MEDFDKFVKIHCDILERALQKQNQNRATDINYSRLRHKSNVKNASILKPSTTTRLLFETEFKNNSSTDQSYSFKAERETEVVVQSTIKSGVTFGGDAKITMKTPDDVMENYAGLKKVLKLEGSADQTITDTVKWSVDNMINVPAYTTLKGELHVHEQSLEIDYEVDNIVSGKVIVVERNADDNTHLGTKEFKIGQIVEGIKRGDIARSGYVDDQQDFKRLQKLAKDWIVEGENIKVPSTIKVKYSYAVKQDVNIVPVQNI